MHKDQLKGKYVQFQMRCLIKTMKGTIAAKKTGGERLGKVVNIVGNTLTIIDGYGEKHRINSKNAIIYGVLKKKKISGLMREMYLEEIEWA